MFRATSARHRDTQPARGRVHETIARRRVEKTPVSGAAVARRAGYPEPSSPSISDVKTGVAEAVRETADHRRRFSVTRPGTHKVSCTLPPGLGRTPTVAQGVSRGPNAPVVAVFRASTATKL